MTWSSVSSEETLIKVWVKSGSGSTTVLTYEQTCLPPRGRTENILEPSPTAWFTPTPTPSSPCRCWYAGHQFPRLGTLACAVKHLTSFLDPICHEDTICGPALAIRCLSCLTAPFLPSADTDLAR